MFRASVKIPSGLHKKMVNLKLLKKKFWTRKQTKKLPSPEPANPLVTACGESPSKCLDLGYGKPLPKPRKSFLNFCRGKPVIKQKPSNCAEEECEKRETFLEYLFGKNVKNQENTAPPTPPVKYVLCCEYSAPKIQKFVEPQPKSPPKFSPPKAVNTKNFIQKSEKIPAKCSAAALFAENYTCENVKKCRTIKVFKVPFEELRPSTSNTKQKFTCRTGVDYGNIFKPMKKNCCAEAVKVGRVSKFPGEILKPPSLVFNADSACDVRTKKVRGTSRLERLKAMVSASKVCPVPDFKDSK